MNLPSRLRMVDFAKSNGIRHLVLDADWYGPEFGKESDPVKGGKSGDVRKLIVYGKSKNFGIWLYLNDVGGRQFPLEETLAHYLKNRETLRTINRRVTASDTLRVTLAPGGGACVILTAAKK